MIKTIGEARAAAAGAKVEPWPLTGSGHEPKRATAQQGAKFVVPVPPTTNKMYRSLVRNGRTRVLLSLAGREYKKHVHLLVRAQRVPFMTGDVRVSATVYFPNRRRDLDNALKMLLDALGNGVAYKDDRQVAEIHVCRELDKDNPRVEVLIEEICQDRG